MAKKSKKKSDLGKGLGVLLQGISTDLNENVEEITPELDKTQVAMIPISAVEVNPWQPRSEFEKEAMEELVESIKVYGLIQPITVRRIEDTKSYQLISGERRLRASKLAGLEELPAYIRNANDQEMMEMALVENILRADLNPMEVAFTFKRLKTEFKLTDEELAERVDRRRSSVTNYLRLLKLPPNIQDALKSKKITMGHAKALAGVEDLLAQTDLFNKVTENNLSVRATEALVAAYQNPKKKSKAPSGLSDSGLPSAYRQIEDGLCRLLEAKVSLKRKKNGNGQIVINFKGDGDLNRLIEFLEKDTF